MGKGVEGIEERMRAKRERRAKLRQKVEKELYIEEANERMAEEVSQVPQETKQKILDLLRESYSIGEVGAELDLDIDVVCAILTENIEENMMLRKEAL